MSHEPQPLPDDMKVAHDILESNGLYGLAQVVRWGGKFQVIAFTERQGYEIIEDDGDPYHHEIFVNRDSNEAEIDKMFFVPHGFHREEYYEKKCRNLGDWQGSYPTLDAFLVEDNFPMWARNSEEVEIDTQAEAFECDYCKGNGFLNTADGPQYCGECNGRGWIWE